MAKFYSEYNLTDLGKGLNRFHPLDNIPDGQMSSLQNLDPRSNGQVATRAGFEQYYGCLPLRANTISKTGTTYKIDFGTALTIDLKDVGQGPIVVTGDLPITSGLLDTGDFTTAFGAHYYANYDITFKETFASGVSATFTKTAVQTGISQQNVFIGWFESDSGSDSSNTELIPEEVVINKTTFLATMTYTNASNISGYFTYLEVPAVAGIVHVETFTAQTTVTILASSHSLDTTNMVVRCYDDDATDLTEIYPETMSINASGDLAVVFGSSTTGRIIIYAAAEVDTHSQVINDDSEDQDITIAGITDPFNFYELWVTSGNTRTNVTPMTISWDAATSTTTMTYTPPAGGENVEVYWKSANFIANSIEFEDIGSISETYSISDPEITVWGICHSGIYKESATRGGHTTQVDNYKSESVEKLVTGVSGNLMQATSYSAGGTTYKMRSLTMRGSNRVSGAQILAPLFTAAVTTRTRGSIYDAAVDSDGYAPVTAVAWVSSGVANYTFTFTAKTGTVTTGTGTPSISVNDYLTVRNCAHDRNNGTFKVLSVVSDSSTSTVLQVTNSGVIDATHDEAISGGQGNVFTDKILLTAAPVFVPTDLMSSDSISGNTIKSVTAGPDDIYIDGITTTTSVADGIKLYVKRTSSVIPLQSSTVETVGSDTDGGFVRGDSLTITGIDNKPKITHINTLATQTLTASVASSVATITIAEHNLNVGQKVFITASSDANFEGEYPVTSVPTTSTFTLATSAADGSPTATLIGKTIEIDESLLYTVGPTTKAVTTEGRWTVVENPKSTAVRVLETKQQHWDEAAATNQAYLKSVVVNDSMFLVNDNDEVKKFDGTNLVNAGLPAWQGWFFASVDSTTYSLSSGITIECDGGSGTTPFSLGYFLVESEGLAVGERFKSSTAGTIYTVQAVVKDSVGFFKVTPDETILSGENVQAPTLTKSNFYRYYVRANAVDINNNIVASTMLGSDDMYIETFTASAIDLKIGGLPPFEELDHDRIEIEVYRTPRNQVAPFYRVHRQLVDYSDLGGYITIKDTVLDANLPISSAPYGNDPTATLPAVPLELGNQWNPPPLASSITTVDDRLVLANIKSPPTLDITFLKVSSNVVIGDFGGGEIQFQKSTAVASSETFNDSAVFSFESSGEVSVTPATHITIGTDKITIDDGASTPPAVGEWLYLFHAAQGENNSLDFAGWYRVTTRVVGSANEFTVSLLHGRSNGAAATTDVDRWVASASSTFSDGERVPVWVGVDGNFNQKYSAEADIETRASTRLGLAINAVMTSDSAANTYWGTTRPTPWLLAKSGQSFGTGGLQVTMVDSPSGTVNTQWKGITNTAVSVFINNLNISDSTSVVVGATLTAASEIRLFNSRLVSSYRNFPEIFDDSFSVLGGEGVIDVNPADGQEIVAAIPFFGQSAFGAANLTQAVVVFKTNSIYLVNVQTGQKQKLQSQGQGCSAPRSVASTKDGIMFVNESGVYKLGWDMKITWVGQMIHDLWDDDLDLTRITEFAGHNFIQDRKYKVSTVLAGASYPSNVVVYDHTREQSGQMGSWTEYTNHAATGWANQSTNAFFGNQSGQVMKVRNAGNITDFRDDASAIATQTLITGGIHYGLPGNRKTTNAVSVQYQGTGILTDIALSTEQSLSGTFNASTEVDIASSNQVVRYSLVERKGTFLRVKITKSGTKDEQLEISRMTFHTKDIGTGGVTQAGDI